MVYKSKMTKMIDFTKDLEKLNSMTKYPSIPTYHKLGDKGILQNETIEFKEKIILTEKVDGVNCRIILLPNGFYLLGSREELLYAKGDMIGNPTLGIVDALKGIAANLPHVQHLTVLYLELYGGKVTRASKNYTDSQQVSHRLFDIAIFPDAEELYSKSPEQLASWRNHGGQTFLEENELTIKANLLRLELTPRIIELKSLPTDIKETHELLKQLAYSSQVVLDKAEGKSEGVVARTPTRNTIAKLRFEDYEKNNR